MGHLDLRFIISTHAWATTVVLLISTPAWSQSRPATMEELQRSLAERDRIISDLQKRIEALENARSASSTSRDISINMQPSASGAAATAPSPVAPPGHPEPSRQTASANTKDEAQGRALERALGREGGLVLPPNTFEMEPQVIYEYHSMPRRQLTLTGQPQFAQQDARRDALQMNMALRTALPWASQIELSIPYTTIRERSEAGESAIDTRRGSGFGDLSLAFSKQLVNERAGWPGVLGTLRWNNAGSAEDSQNPVKVRNSFRSLDGVLTVVKQKDPIVYFGHIGYTLYDARRIDNVRVDPGNTVSIKLGSIFALRPDSSLSLAVEVGRARRTRIGGVKVLGSDTATGIFDVGFSYALTPKVLLDVQTGIGLTSDSPNYRLGISLPVQF